MPSIVPISEGHGEISALPILINRILEAQGLDDGIDVVDPINEPKGKGDVVKRLESYAQLALDSTADDARIIVLVDQDYTDCAGILGPALQNRLESVPGNTKCAAVVAVLEYENWLIADTSALERDPNFRNNITPVEKPEAMPNAEDWLSSQRSDGFDYRPTLDQARLTELVDVETIRERCRSFDKLWREVARLAR